MKTKHLSKIIPFLLIFIITAFLSACGKSHSLTKYEGYMVESVDNSAKDSLALPATLGFDITGTKFLTRDCWVVVKSNSANGGEIAGGQNCSFVNAATTYNVKLQDGTFEITKSPDGKHQLVTVKFNGATNDGAKYKYVFKGQKSGT